MKYYKYKIITKQGKKIENIIEAEDLDSAKSSLSKQGDLIYILEDKKKFKINLFNGSSKGPLNLKERVEFFTEFSSLIDIGLSIKENFEILKENDILRPKIRYLSSSVYKDLEKGDALHITLKKHKIPDYICEIINIGNKSSKLKERLKIIVMVETLNKKISSVLTSMILVPSLMLIFFSGVYVALSKTIIPKFQQNLENVVRGNEMPKQRQIVFDIRNNIEVNLMILYRIIITIFGGLIASYILVQPFKLWVEKVKLKIPMIGAFLKLRDLTIVSKILSITLGTDYKKDEAIGNCKNQIINLYTKKKMDEVINMVRMGKEISDAVYQSNFDRGLAIILKTGEIGGKDKTRLPLMLNKGRDSYIERIEIQIDRLKSTKSIFNLIFTFLMAIPILLGVLIPQLSLVTYATQNLM